MLQKDKFTTKSSPSNTAKPAGASRSSKAEGLEAAVQYVKGVGPKLGAVFKNKGIHTIKDLFYFLPRGYEDRSRLADTASLVDGESATLAVRVTGQRQIYIPKLGRNLLEVRCQNQSDFGQILLKWFHAPRGMEKRFVNGATFVITGKIKLNLAGPEMIHPEITWGSSSASDLSSVSPSSRASTGTTPGALSGSLPGSGNAMESEGSSGFGRVVPIYVELEGIPSRTFRKVLWEAVQSFLHLLIEDLPQYLLDRYQFSPLATAIKNLHFPPEEASYSLDALDEVRTPAQTRLIYEEFFKFEYLTLRRKLQIEKSFALSFGSLSGRGFAKKLLGTLPFQLTSGQVSALSEILEDLSQSHPMNRLVQGDVGAGKTVVAFLSAAAVLAEGGQVALMVPTEILAEQHFKNAQKLFGSQIKVVLLTGKTSGADRRLLQAQLLSGEPLLAIGTHALIEDPVVFARLGLVIIDEQHRFGVDQRRRLRFKGVFQDSQTGEKVIPHCLVMTATPIPRTLALTVYGDLAITAIRDLPPGRSPIQTKVIKAIRDREHAYQQIKEQLLAGRQAYFIYPLVQDSEAEGFTELKSAVAQAEALSTKIFREFKIGLLHGQLTSDEKASVMDQFKFGDVQVLVSTTVVEVGVDVPNATVMVIEHAERFGLSQLHQLRGRVGRGKYQSYCYLFTHPKASETTAYRLEVLEETHDGFKIAEADLEIRGPGEFIGTRQAGALPFRLGDIVRDKEWLLKAREDVLVIMRDDPELVQTQNVRLLNYYLREGKVQFARLNTS